MVPAIPFRTLSLAGACLTAVLALAWIGWPQIFFRLWQIESGAGALQVGRRGGALFAGMALMLFLARDANPSPVRNGLAAGFATACALLAVLGLTSLAYGLAGPAILAAVAAEIVFAIGFFATLRRA